MYSIINSTNHYYNPETIQIKITQDNKCIIQSIINNQNNHSNNNFNLSPNILNKTKTPILNKNLINSPANNNIIFKNNDNNLINTNSLRIINDNNNHNYLNNINNEEDDIDIINNNGEDNLLISFSNISELTKNNINNNSFIEKDPKDNLKTSSVCNYFEFTPTPNNRNNDNNLLKINNKTYNNEIKKRNLNYIFNILNSDNKSITKKHYCNKIVDDNNLSYSNSINNISSIKLRNSNKKEKNNFVIETMKNINIINKSNEKVNLNNQNYKIDNVKKIQINKTQKENKDMNLNTNNNENLDLYKTMTKHLSNFSFGINNFNIITNPISNLKNNNGSYNNINSEENNIILDNIEDTNNNNFNNNNTYHTNEKKINLNTTNNQNDINILEDNNNYFSPKFNIINNVNNNIGQLGKERDYKIYHLDLSEINNNINNTKNNVINKEKYNNLQLTDGFPSFSIIDNQNKTKNYIKKKYTGAVTDKGKMRINPKDKCINTNYINNTHSNLKNLNNLKRISNTNEKQKDSYCFYNNFYTTNPNFIKKTLSNGNRNKINKKIKKNNFLSDRSNNENIPSKINKDKNDSYNGNLSFNKTQNKGKNTLRKNNSFQKYQNTNGDDNKNRKKHNNIDQNLKERIQSILEKKLNLILSRNISNNKINDIHSISEKKLNSKKNNNNKANNEIFFVNEYSNNNNYNKSNNSYNVDAISTSNYSNSNKKSYSTSHMNHNKKIKFNSKPSSLVKKNKWKKINSKIVFNKNPSTLKKNIYPKKEKEENKTKNYINKKDIKFQNNNNNRIDDIFYNNNSKKTNKEYNNNNEIRLNKFIPMKTRIDETFQKTYIIENKDINILNLGSGDISKEIKIYNGTDDDINNMNGNYGDDNLYYKINNQNVGIDSNDEAVNYINNNNNNFIINNKANLTFVNNHKKPLVVIQDFSKYKKKNIAN